MAGMELVIPPAIEPVTLAEIKAQLKIEEDDDSADDQINPLIPVAREWCEDHQKRAYITQTRELALDQWPCSNEIKLPRPNLQSVVYLQYTDSEGITTTWDSSNYMADRFAKPGRLVKNRGVCWPTVCLTPANGVIVRYVAGYGDSAEDVPARIRQAIILLICYWYENGKCDPPCAVTSLLANGRIMDVG